MPEMLPMALAAAVAIIAAICAVAATLHVRTTVDALLSAIEGDQAEMEGAIAAAPAVGVGGVTIRVCDRGPDVVLFLEVGDACRTAASLTPKEASDLADMLLDAGYAAAGRATKPEPDGAA